MRFPVLLLALFLVGCASLVAQSKVLLVADSASSAPSAADTVAAIHRLFAAKRKICTYVAGGTAVATSVGAITALGQPAHLSAGFSVGIDGRPIMAALLGVVGGSLIGLELLTLGGWGPREEARMVTAFHQRQLPWSIRRRLQPKYFPTAGQ